MKTTDRQSPARHAGGRPPKFAGPRRVVTLTLPERTIAQLESVDTDRARAIAQLAELVTKDGAAPRAHPPVEMIQTAPGIGIILISRCPSLTRIPFLHLIPVGPSRFLLALDPGISADSLEVALLDLLDDVPEERKVERRVIEELRHQIKGLRQTRRVRKAEILFVTL